MSLINASRNGDLELVKKLLDSGSDPNEYHIFTRPLIAASAEGQNEVIKLLLDRGADINIRNTNFSPLLIAAREGYLETIKLLLERGANINLQNNGARETALHFAAYYDQYAVVKLLLESGIDPFILNKYGHNALELCDTKECKDLISKYMWERLYSRDKSQAEKLKGVEGLTKDIWEIILLQKRQQMLCKNLSDDRNKDVLKYFALELNIPVNEDMTKKDLYNLISKYIVFGKVEKKF